MNDLIYKRLIDENDIDILIIKEIHELPQVAKYISISNNYFHYVTNTANVFFYKVYDGNELLGTVHLEIENDTLYMAILIFPEFQKSGYGTKVIKDIKNKSLGIDYKKIKISIDGKNLVSLRMFKNLGFVVVSKDDELLNLIYDIDY